MSDDAQPSAQTGANTNSLRIATDWSFVLDRPQRLGVAVSGGSDSMALLELMAWQASDKGFELHAVTVDHGLRPEAKDEAAIVAAFCADRGIPHDILTWDGWDGKGNLQARARKARYSLIAEWALRKGVDWVALGHTEDDQAETVLMRLARRSGVDGLAGMPDRFERDGIRWIRPLLYQKREELRDYLRHREIAWCDDPSNEDDSFERVRARKAALTLGEIGVDAEALVAVAHNMGSAKSALNHYAWAEVAEHKAVVIDRGDVILPETATSRELFVPSEVVRRLKTSAIQWISGAEYPPRNSALLNMDVALSMGAYRHTLSGCLVVHSKAESSINRRYRITREYNAVKDLVSSTNALWDGRWALDGPHSPEFEVRALGEAVKDCPEWRETGLPRQSLLASPSIWRGETLVSAPLAGLANGWAASATGRGTFAQFLLSR